MTTIGTDATSWSAERRALAAKLAGDCRPDLGQAVLITGSVARGVADHYSDLEMRFLVEALQPISVYHEWLRSASGMVELEENAEHVSGTRTKSWHNGIFVESLWLPWSVLDATLGAVIRAETTNHWKLTEAWHIADALPLREHGRLTIWQERLQRVSRRAARPPHRANSGDVERAGLVANLGRERLAAGSARRSPGARRPADRISGARPAHPLRTESPLGARL